MPMVLPAIGAVVGAITTAATAATVAVVSATGLAAANFGVAFAIVNTVTALTPTLLSLGALEIASILTAPKVGQTAAGTQVDWQADPTAPVPYLIGRTGTSGTITLQDVSADTNHKYLWITSTYSCAGPVRSIGAFTANSVAVSFTADGGEGAGAGSPTTTLTQAVAAGATVLPVASVANFAAGQSITVGGETVIIDSVYSIGTEFSLKSPLGQAHGANTTVTGPGSTDFYQNRLWWKPILGQQAGQFVTFTATNSKDTPANHQGIAPTWTASCTMSGLAGSIMACEYDAAKYPTGVIKPQVVIEGVSAYDPRQDSTYPGGSGPCRIGDETTWVYTQNPYIHALTWLIGRRSNGKPTMGLHAPLNAIDVPAFVDGANVSDSHGWTLGGVVYSTDGKRDVLRSMLKAGSGAPIPLGAKVSCIVDAPKVSLDTLTGADVVGDVSIAAIQPARSAPNTIWPRYREEAQGWNIVPTAAPIQVTDYFAHDGGQRSKEVEYTLCQSADQAATLARYDIENAREFGPITLPCKPRWRGYRPGDCITVDEPEYGLNGQKCVILNRTTDPATFITTLTLRSETDGKHAFALGETADPPPIPGLTGVDIFNVPAPEETDWLALGGLLEGDDGNAAPVILVTGTPSNPNAARALIDYRLTGSTVWSQSVALDLKYDTQVSTQLTGLPASTGFIVGVRYLSVRGIPGDRLELGTDASPISTGDLAIGTEEQIIDGVHLAAATGGNALVDTDFQFVSDFWCQNYDETYSCGPATRVLLNGKGALQRATAGTPAAGKEFAVGQGYGGRLISANEQEVRSYSLPCKPGDKIEASAYATCANVSRVNAEVYFWDANGTSIQPPQEITPFITDFSALSNPDGGIAAMIRPGGFTTAPAHAAYATLQVIAFTNGAGPASLTIQAPMLRIAQAGATELSAATPGVGVPEADKTATHTAQNVAGQGPLATSGQTPSQVDNTNVALGSNLVIDSSLQQGLSYFGPGFSSPLAPAQIQRNWRQGARGNLVEAYILGGLSNNAQGGVFDIFLSDPYNAASVSDLQRFACPVNAEDALYASVHALYGNGATGVQCLVLWFDASGAQVSYSQRAAGGRNIGGDYTGLNGDIDNYMDRVGGFITAPANARYAVVIARVVYPANLNSDAHAAAARPYLAKVAAGQTAPPPYTPGPTDRAADQTASNTAQNVTGQGPWATTPTPVAGVTKPSPNVIRNPSFALGAQNWPISGGFVFGVNGGDLGSNASTTQQTAFLRSDAIPMYGSVQVTIQVYGGGVWDTTKPPPGFGMQYFDAQGNYISIDGAALSEGFPYLTHSFTVTTPSNCALIAACVYTDQNTAFGPGGFLAVTKVKVALESSLSVFTDDATYGAAYDDKTSIQLLKPGELGANVTENRTASHVNGQGALATTDKVNLGSQVTSVLGTSYVFDPTTGRYLSNVMPAQANADQTSQNTAHFIQGQGALAILSKLTEGTQVTYPMAASYAVTLNPQYPLSSPYPGQINIQTTYVRVSGLNGYTFPLPQSTLNVGYGTNVWVFWNFGGHFDYIENSFPTDQLANANGTYLFVGLQVAQDVNNNYPYQNPKPPGGASGLGVLG